MTRRTPHWPELEIGRHQPGGNTSETLKYLLAQSLSSHAINDFAGFRYRANMRIAPCRPDEVDVLARLRARLWPETGIAEHLAEIEQTADNPDAPALLAHTDDDVVVGFAEATLRHDYVNGCDTSPVAYWEGIYVELGHRRTGAARDLCAAVEKRGRSLGCTELGSDALLDNPLGRALHVGLGFEERERVVCYRKLLSHNN